MATPQFYKRHCMECPLDTDIPRPELPHGFYWIPWNENLLAAHSELIHACFQSEIDVNIFPVFAQLTGCKSLMEAIRAQGGFCPRATWLLATPDGVIGGVQGLKQRHGVGAIQNLGIVPGYRGCGFGRAILLQALAGFRANGCLRAYLEVTAANAAAVRLYRKLGFRNVRTVYRSAAEPILIGADI